MTHFGCAKFKLYKKSSNKFSKLKSGFRPDSISDNEAIRIAVSNIYTPFIFDFINDYLDSWIKETDLFLKNHKDEYSDYNISLAVMLNKSVFNQNIPIYFKLKNKVVNEEYISLMYSLMTEINGRQYLQKNEKDEKIKEEQSVRIADLEKTEEVHLKKIEVLEAKIEKTVEQYEAALLQIEQLMVDNNILEERMHELKACEEYDDYEEIEKLLDQSKDFISFCEVSNTDYNGQKWLNRLADINKKGELEVFRLNEDIPRYFSNRPKIFFKEGPSEEGMVGVWDWMAIPNKMDPSKDYVTSSYNAHLCPIEVIPVQDCNDEEELLKRLKSGIDVKVVTKRFLFAVFLSQNVKGYLCSEKEIENNKGILKIRENVVSIPTYEFSRRQLVHLDNNKYFFRRISIGIPNSITYLKSPYEIVKQIIMKRWSWQSFKQLGKSRSDWKIFKDFFANLEFEPITDIICRELNYPEEKARNLLEDFVKIAISYIDGKTIEDEILLSLLAVDDTLMDQCINLVKEQWEKDHQRELKNAKTELESITLKAQQTQNEIKRKILDGNQEIKNQIDKVNSLVADLEYKKEKLQTELSNIENSIFEKEQFALNVEELVAERIKKAQDNAAEFIANMAFINPSQTQRSVRLTTMEDFSAQDEIDVYAFNNRSFYKKGTQLDNEKLEEYEDWKTALDFITDALVDAGVIQNYTKPFAAFLLTSYLTHCPILLIGPSSNEIVDAVSVSLFGKMAGELSLCDKYSSDVIKECYASEDEIIKIKNPFASDWITRLPEFISIPEKYFIAVYPFVEDVQIEPKSLFNYFIPVFTDFLVDKMPKQSFFGGFRSSNYIEFSIKQPIKDYETLLNSLHASSLLKIKMQTIMTNMHKMIGHNNNDFDIMFLILPYAYSTMQLDKLVDAINNSAKYKFKVSADTLRTVSGYIGVDE